MRHQSGLESQTELVCPPVRRRAPAHLNTTRGWQSALKNRQHRSKEKPK